MKMTPGILACMLVLSSSCCLLSQTRKPAMITEKIEWTWADRPEHPNGSLPNVLLLGDSITRAYYPETAKELDGVANVYLFATSCSSGDSRLAGQMRDYFAMAGVQFTVVHFNNGMHGWGYSEAQYSGGLPGFVGVLHKASPKASLIWATTTPVRKDATGVGATNIRIDDRNRLATAVMKREDILIDDQHALMIDHQDLHADDVHFTEKGSALQAHAVAASVREALRPRS